MRPHLLACLAFALCVAGSAGSWKGGLSGAVSVDPPSVKVSAKASLNIGDAQAGIGVQGTLSPNGDSVSVSGGIAGGPLDVFQGTILAPLIDSFAHVNGTFNTPAGEDIVALAQELYGCVGGAEDPLTCSLDTIQAALGPCARVATDYTNCPAVMEQVR
jgi:hypothetical protein